MPDDQPPVPDTDADPSPSRAGRATATGHPADGGRPEDTGVGRHHGTSAGAGPGAADDEYEPL